MSNRQHPAPPPPGHNLPDGHSYQGQPYPAQQAPEPRRKSWFARHKILTGILGALALFMIIGALGGGDDESPGAAAQTSAASSAEEGTGSSVSSQGSTTDEPAAEDETAEEELAEEPAEDEADVPTVGDVVTVGDFEVTVTGQEVGLARVGDDMFGEEAQGQFVKVFVTVQNTGTSAEYFLDSDQKLVDEQGRQHSTSSSAWLLDEESLFLTEINPGNTVEGVLLYDIPADATPTTLELQAGFLSGVVSVSLAG